MAADIEDERKMQQLVLTLAGSITVILGYAEIAIDTHQLNPELESYIEKIRVEASRAAALVHSHLSSNTLRGGQQGP